MPTIIDFCGFETNSTLEAYNTYGTYSIQSTIVRSGNYALRVNPPATSSSGWTMGAPFTTTGGRGSFNAATLYVRFYIRFASFPSADSEDIFSCYETSGSAYKGFVRVTSGGKLQLYQKDGTTQVGSDSSTTLNLDTWYRVEIKIPTGASASGEVKIEGNSEISGTGDFSTNNATWFGIGRLINRYDHSFDMYFDDMCWASDDYPGEGQTVLMSIDGNGNGTGWSASTGDKYTCVDETPPNAPSTTDYVKSDEISNSAYSASMASPSSSGIGAGDTVNCISVGNFVVRDGSSNGACRIGLRSNTTNSDTSSNLTVTATQALAKKVYNTDPATSSAWSVSGLETVEPRVIERSTSRFSRCFAMTVMVEFTPATTIEISPDDAAHSQSADVPLISQEQHVSPGDAAHSHTADSPSLSQSYIISPDDATHSQTADAPPVSQNYIVSPNDTSHTQSCDSPNISQEYLLSPSSAEHSQTADPPTLSQNYVASADDAQHEQSADSPLLSQEFSVSPSDSSHSQSVEEPDLSQGFSVSPDDTIHDSTADNVATSQDYRVSPEDTGHTNTTDEAEISQEFSVDADDTTHEQTSDSSNLEQDYRISPDNANHGQSAEIANLSQEYSADPDSTNHAVSSGEPELSQDFLVSPNDATHGQTADSPTLLQEYRLSPDDTTHEQKAEAPDISQTFSVSPDDTVHAHTAGVASLNQDYHISPSDTEHSQTSDSPSLEQDHRISPDDALHEQTSDNATLSQNSFITPNDAQHEQSTESPAVFQDHHISPDSTEHTNSSDAAVVYQDYLVDADSTVHNVASESPDVAQGYIINPSDALHSQTAEGASLLQEFSVSPSDTSHEQSAQTPGVSQNFSVPPDSALHEQSAEDPELSQEFSVSPNDSYHEHASGEAGIVQDYLLSPEDSTHAQTVDEGNLVQDYAVLADDTTHSSTAESPYISTGETYTISPDDANHAQEADLPGLSQDYAVSPDNAEHSQSADSPTISSDLYKIYPEPIESAEYFGSLSITSEINIISGIASGEETGEPSITLVVVSGSVESSEEFGVAAIIASAIVEPSSIDSGEAFGSPTVGDIIIRCIGVESSETFGTPSISTSSTSPGSSGGKKRVRVFRFDKIFPPNENDDDLLETGKSFDVGEAPDVMPEFYSEMFSFYLENQKMAGALRNDYWNWKECYEETKRRLPDDTRVAMPFLYATTTDSVSATINSIREISDITGANPLMIENFLNCWRQTTYKSFRMLYLQRAIARAWKMGISQTQYNLMEEARDFARRVAYAKWLDKYDKSNKEHRFETEYGEPIEQYIKLRRQDFIPSPQDLSIFMAIYKITQVTLRASGFQPEDSITLFKGVEYDEKPIGSVVKYLGNTIESWSMSSGVAGKYGNIKLATTLRIKNIVSLPTTGFGSLNAGEVVVAGLTNADVLVVR